MTGTYGEVYRYKSVQNLQVVKTTTYEGFGKVYCSAEDRNQWWG